MSVEGGADSGLQAVSRLVN